MAEELRMVNAPDGTPRVPSHGTPGYERDMLFKDGTNKLAHISESRAAKWSVTPACASCGLGFLTPKGVGRVAHQGLAAGNVTLTSRGGWSIGDSNP